MKYKTVVIDPPWPMNDNQPLEAEHDRDNKITCRITRPYDCITLEEIEEIGVPVDISKDCILWLWTTNMNLPNAFKLLERWGFTYRTCLTWVKNTVGLGYWLRGKTEHCLLATKGSPEWTNTTVSTALFADMVGDSRKPARFYQVIREICPKPRIDIFARNAHEGFDGWGDEYVGEGPLAPYLKEKMK